MDLCNLCEEIFTKKELLDLRIALKYGKVFMYLTYTLKGSIIHEKNQRLFLQ